MDGDKIIDINETNFKGTNFKYEACLGVIEKYNNEEIKVYGIGDSAVDIQISTA